ncbi:sensor histidine kinase [Microbacterium stercoris]|uniref:Sensor-like histidine kinase SenX3 n=1 Tax=Microbacterium stercoris TaxID=2820289 RepID=A0A939QKG2_9MICO|nr:ATP-binding protein [Microbacterium stercoris]MBO3663800.1 two-component sensor histidine kinase [Microbacterium stercoris]
MAPTQLALLSLLLGVLIGTGVCVIVFVAIRARERAERERAGLVPAGITQVLDAMDDPAALVDASGLVVATSPTAAWLGIEPQATLPQEGLRELVRAARSGSTETENLRLQRGGMSSESRLVAARATRVSARHTLLLLRDLTEQERLEEMRHDFIANTSHELKTPVGAIMLLAEAIEMAADDAAQVRAFTPRLSAEAERLGTLTGRIMNLSRLQAAEELTSVGHVAIDEVVTSAVEAHVVQAESAGVELTRGGDRGLYVRGDQQILKEAIGNLVANAIAYSPRGSHVGIGVHRSGDVVEIAVTDQGIGITEADQQRVFERFYRADQARSRRTGGSGLGLSIVKHAVSRHGGEIKLWSQPHRGSTFTVRLPLSDPPALESPDAKAAKARADKLKKIKKQNPAEIPAARAKK